MIEAKPDAVKDAPVADAVTDDAKETKPAKEIPGLENPRLPSLRVHLGQEEPPEPRPRTSSRRASRSSSCPAGCAATRRRTSCPAARPRTRIGELNAAFLPDGCAHRARREPRPPRSFLPPRRHRLRLPSRPRFSSSGSAFTPPTTIRASPSGTARLAADAIDSTSCNASQGAPGVRPPWKRMREQVASARSPSSGSAHRDARAGDRAARGDPRAHHHVQQRREEAERADQGPQLALARHRQGVRRVQGKVSASGVRESIRSSRGSG